jgi:hypothetical protein
MLLHKKHIFAFVLFAFQLAGQSLALADWKTDWEKLVQAAKKEG